MKIKKTNKSYIINYSKEGEYIDMDETLDQFFDLCKKYDATVSIVNNLFEVNYCPCCKAEGNPNSVAYIHVNYDFIKNLSSSTTDKTLN